VTYAYDHKASWKGYKALPSLQTVDDVRRVVDYIASIQDDNEVAHGAEDDMRSRVLELIATGHSDPAALAIAALESSAITFGRWYA